MKIVGYTVGTSLPKPDFNQNDPKKGDYIKNKPDFNGLRTALEDTLSIDITDVEQGTATGINADTLGGVAAKNYVLKTDTVENAAKLGGYAPEYFTWTDNLLLNSNFQSPYLINMNGLSSYGTDMNGGDITVDGWKKDKATTATVNNDCIILSGNDNGFYQVLSDNLLKRINGKICTMALMAKANTADASIRFGVGSGGGYESFNLTSDWTIVARQYTYDYTNYPSRNNIVIRAVGDVSVRWAVLYEGSFTADTLPQPQWLHPRMEMMRMGLPTNPVNLLDNSDFSNLVIQTEFMGKHGTTSYLADRWIATNCSATQKDGYVSITATKNTSGVEQKVSGCAGKTVTLVAKVNNSAACRLAIMTYDTSVAFFATADATNTGEKIMFCTTTIPEDEENITVKFYSGRTSEGGTSSIYWMALYEGAYTAETLPPYVPKGYTAELAECQRYYYRITSSAATFSYATGFAYSDTTARLNLYLPQIMRTTPTLTYQAGDYLRVVSENSYKDITNLALNSVRGHNVLIIATTTGLTAKALAVLMLGSSILEFSADL